MTRETKKRERERERQKLANLRLTTNLASELAPPCPDEGANAPVKHAQLTPCPILAFRPRPAQNKPR